MSEEVKKLIKYHANRIRASIPVNSYLFGEPFDPTDPDSVLVAVESMADLKKINAVQHERDFLMTLYKGRT